VDGKVLDNDIDVLMGRPYLIYPIKKAMEAANDN
jgi:hypothetical protein